MSSRRLEVGEQFAGLRVEKQIGEGGFATVYVAIDGDGRRVALKVLHDAGDGYDATTIARYEREVAILSRLQSPHTVRLLRHGKHQDDGCLYLVFELLGGQDLVELLNVRGKLRVEEVDAILRQLLHALAEAHRAGLLHRDIKPHNVRVVSERPLDVRLLDFGIARFTDDGHPSVTKTGELVGTPRYMSPEQLMVQSLGPASDIYSLGMVAFELLMGRDALAQNNVWSQVGRLREGHQFSVPNPSPGQQRLVRVIEKMTARDIERRFQTARAVLAALNAPEQREPTARPLQPSSAPPTRSRWIAPAVCAALLGTGLAAWLVTRTTEPPAPEPQPRQLTAVSKVVGAPAEPSDPRPGPPPEIAPPAPQHGTTGCGKPAPQAGIGRLFGEATYVPKDYDPYRAHPLLVLAHHKWDDPSEFVAKSGFAELADLRHFVILAPNNGNNAWEKPDRFLPALRLAVDDLKNTICIDERRVYVVGHSRGGRAALSASCEPWASAVAVNSYLPKEDEYRERWWCDRPAPTIWLSPNDSHMVRLDGERGCVSPRITLRAFESAWRDRNRCSRKSEKLRVTGGVCNTWSCEAPFRSCTLDGGHYWPGMPPHSIDVMNCQHQGFEEPPAPRFAIAEQIWSFFDSIPLEEDATALPTSDAGTSTPR